MSELEQRFDPTQPPVIGAIQPSEQIYWLDHDAAYCHKHLLETKGKPPTDEEVMDQLRQEIYAVAQDTPIYQDLLTTALIVGGDYRRFGDLAMAESAPKLSPITRQFYTGEAFGTAQIIAWLSEYDIELDQYGSYLERMPKTNLSQRQLRPAQEVELKDDILYGGLRSYDSFRPYWQPVVERYPGLFAPGGVEPRLAQAGIGHAISLFDRALGPFVAMEYGQATKSDQRRLTRYFSQDLEEIDTIADINWQE